MFTDSQDKPLIARRCQKIGTLNPLIFDRNHGKDHEDTAKSLAVSNNYQI